MDAHQLDFFAADEPDPAPRDPLRAPSPSGLQPGAPNPDGLVLGICAWAHEDYRGRFYPKGLPRDRELAYYARFCNAVEIDSSFYRVPSKRAVDRWVEETPPGFRFAMKAPRSVTHDALLLLENRQAREDWTAMCAVLPRFGRKLASLLVQLSPRATILLANDLAKLLEEVPAGIPVAVEFRHPSWNKPEIDAMLRQHGAVRVWADHYLDPRRDVAAEDNCVWSETGSFRYIRLLGDVSTKYKPGRNMGARNFTYGSILFDRGADRSDWVRRVQKELKRGVQVQLFINNHYEGFSVQTADSIRRALTGKKED